MSKGMKFCVVLSYMILAVMLLNGPVAAKSVSIKVSAFGSPTSPNVQAGKFMAEYVKEKSNGDIVMEIYPGATLSSGKQKGSIEQVQIGSIECVLSDVALFTPWEKKLSVMSLPFLFKDHAAMHAFSKSDTCKNTAALLEKKGLKVAGIWSRLPRQFVNTKRPIKGLDDLKGLKIRVPGSKVYSSIWKNLGANPTPMAWGEVYTSLQLGTIDGVEQPLHILITSGIYEIAEYVTVSNYLTGFVFVAYNKGFFESLSPEHQKIVVDGAAAANEFKHNNDKKMQADALEKLKEKGTQLHYPTEAELEQYKKATAPTWDEYRGVVGQDLIDQVLKQIAALE